MPKIPDKIYNVLKWVAMLVLPAVAIFVNTLGAIWGWSHAGQVSDTIVAVNALLAACLGLSNIAYYKEARNAQDD